MVHPVLSIYVPCLFSLCVFFHIRLILLLKSHPLCKKTVIIEITNGCKNHGSTHFLILTYRIALQQFWCQSIQIGSFDRWKEQNQNCDLIISWCVNYWCGRKVIQKRCIDNLIIDNSPSNLPKNIIFATSIVFVTNELHIWTNWKIIFWEPL